MGDILSAHMNHPMTANLSQHESAARVLSMIAPFGRCRGSEQLQSLLYSIISGVLAPYRGSCNSLASPSSIQQGSEIVHQRVIRPFSSRQQGCVGQQARVHPVLGCRTVVQMSALHLTGGR